MVAIAVQRGVGKKSQDFLVHTQTLKSAVFALGSSSFQICLCSRRKLGGAVGQTLNPPSSRFVDCSFRALYDTGWFREIETGT